MTDLSELPGGANYLGDTFATIICDASFHHRTGQYGWAGRVVMNKQRRAYQGPGKVAVSSSNDAELYAVVNTLYCVNRDRDIWQPPCGWLIQTDNMHVVRLINHEFSARSHSRTGPSVSPEQGKGLKAMGQLIMDGKPSFVLARHVKGHVDATTEQTIARHYVQANADAAAGAMALQGARR